MTQAVGKRQEAVGARFVRQPGPAPYSLPCPSKLREERSGVPAPPSAGFTLLEALVSVFILALLSSILLVGATAARRQAVVRSAAHEVAGFLRETRGLSLNGVKNPGCVDPQRPECSRYVVTFDDPSQDPPRNYVRRAEGEGAVVQAALPAGARFGVAGRRNLNFQYTPPTINVNPATSVLISHASGFPIMWVVCVSSMGSVEVKSGRDC